LPRATTNRTAQITINDVTVGRSVDEALRLIDAYQFTDKYGEVCPANWNPGQETLKATPEGNKQYLEKVYSDTTMTGIKPGKVVVNGKAD
jgi:peroxiredoxin 2/4